MGTFLGPQTFRAESKYSKAQILWAGGGSTFFRGLESLWYAALEYGVLALEQRRHPTGIT